MSNKYFLTLITLFYISISFSQNNLNAYKYVIVPKKYDFLKEEDKYQLNSLTKFLFSKKGFETVYEGESYPADLINNPCLAVTTELTENSNLFISKISIKLTDCYNKVVFTSIQGKSKEKDYQASYHESLRNAFVSINKLDYNFNPELVVNKTIAVQSQDPKIVQNEIPKTAIVTTIITEPSNTVTSKESIARSYKNDQISFFLIEQNNSLIAYINQCKDETYQKGEMIATLIKTSLPNVYRVTWKNKRGEFEDTTGYFDEAGNLMIDFNNNGKIEVREYQIEK